MDTIKEVIGDLEKIESIEIDKTPLAAVSKETIKKALAVLEEFSQELAKKDDLT